MEERIVDLRTECDFCKQTIPDNRGYKQNSVEIEASLGDCYPECDTRTTYEIDCCPDCFLNKVKPQLEESFGVEFRERAADDYGVHRVMVESKPVQIIEHIDLQNMFDDIMEHTASSGKKVFSYDEHKTLRLGFIDNESNILWQISLPQVSRTGKQIKNLELLKHLLTSEGRVQIAKYLNHEE